MSVTTDVEVVFGRRGVRAASGRHAGAKGRSGDDHGGDPSHPPEAAAEGPVLLLRREAGNGLKHAARDFVTLPVDALEARWSPRKAMTFVIVASAGLWVVIGLIAFAAIRLTHP